MENFFNFHEINYNYHNYPSYQLGESMLKYLLKLPLVIFHIFNLFIKYKPDIIHINDIRTLITWLPIVFIFKKKIIYHHRNFLPKSKIIHFVLKKVKIISTSNYLSQSLPNYINSKVIYNPVEIDEKKYVDSKLNKEIIIGFFGNFTEQKKPEIFIQTIFLLKKVISIKGIMVGRLNHDELLKIKSLIKKKELLDFITIINFQNDPYYLMSKCNFIICPSVENHLEELQLNQVS